MAEKVDNDDSLSFPNIIYKRRFQTPAAITFCGITGVTGYLTARRGRESDYNTAFITNTKNSAGLLRSVFHFSRGFLLSSLFAAPVAYFVGRSFVNDSIDYDANGRYKDYPIMTRSIFSSVETGLKYAAVAGVPAGGLLGIMADGFSSSGASPRPGSIMGYSVVFWLGVCAASVPVSTAVGVVVGWQRERSEGDQPPMS